MPLQPFSFPFPQTRFFKAETYIYKLKIRAGSSYSGVEATGGHLYNLEHEMEDIIRTVLGNLESLQPFTTTHFHVYPYKKPWERVSRVMCKHGEEVVKAYPFTLLLYLEKNMHTDSFTKDTADRRQEECEEPQQGLHQLCTKRKRTDSPLEDAILQDMVEDMEAETAVSVLRPHETKLLLRRPSDEDSQHEDKQFADVDSVPDAAEDDEEAEEADGEDSPKSPGMLSTLARHIFPFSLFFRTSSQT